MWVHETDGLGNFTIVAFSTSDFVTVDQDDLEAIPAGMHKTKLHQLPQLETVNNGLMVAQVSNLFAPILKAVGRNLTVQSTSLQLLFLPQLETVGGRLGSLSFPVLLSVGDAFRFIHNDSLGQLSFLILNDMSDDILMAACNGLHLFNKFESLQAVRGSIDLRGTLSAMKFYSLKLADTTVVTTVRVDCSKLKT
ncbi:hypothetical protein IWQ60_003527 [Tieghemiomyces parasiticus]|uniref:Uncharacterized protein n=1 Tax=Tieghemiomyces parasiticus TaxID=78921 RepID=A0A9W8AA60_9FUNG|nr:hypothetical protein IWQ60_003527 [Tieghemiomyces parasiticus]